MPARTVIAVADLPMGAAVQVEAVVSHGMVRHHKRLKIDMD